MPEHQRTYTLIIKTHYSSFTIILLTNTIYDCRNSQYSTMDVTDYWPMAREYSIWNATVAALQFWTADLKAYVLSSAI